MRCLRSRRADRDVLGWRGQASNDDGTAFGEAGMVAVSRACRARSASRRSDRHRRASRRSQCRRRHHHRAARLRRRVRRRELRGLQTTVAQQVIMPSTNAAAGDWELRFRMGPNGVVMDVIPICRSSWPGGPFLRDRQVDVPGAVRVVQQRARARPAGTGFEPEGRGKVASPPMPASRTAAWRSRPTATSWSSRSKDRMARMKLKVKDSGKGFRFPWPGNSDAAHCSRTGERGIGLIEQPCSESVEYRAGGSRSRPRLLAPLMAQ